MVEQSVFYDDIDMKNEGKVREILPRMTLDEFENLDEGIHGELINGRFYAMASPTATHQRINGYIYRRIANFIESKGGGCEPFIAPFDVDIFKNGEAILEPDVMVICDPKNIDEKRLNGAPDFVVEVVSPSNPAHDYVRKYDMYLKAGVKEYWVVDPIKKQTRDYIFGDGTDRNIYVRLYDFAEDAMVYMYDDELKINLSEFAE